MSDWGNSRDFEVGVSDDSIKKAYDLLSAINERAFGKVIYSALKNTAARGEAQLIELAHKTYKIPRKKLRHHTIVSHKINYNGRDTTAQITIASGRIPLIEFDVKEVEGGIYAIVKRLSKGGIIPRAFITTIRSNGYTGVFQRKGDERYPIDHLYSLSTAEMIFSAHLNPDARDVVDKVYETIRSTFKDNIEIGIDVVLRGVWNV